LSRVRIQRSSDLEHRGPAVRGARVIAALIATLAAWSLMRSAGDVTRLHVSTPWIVIGAAFVTAALLREIGRGLPAALPRPRWSTGLVAAWAACSGLLFVALSVLSTGGGPLGSGAWSAVAVAVCLGLLLATSLQGARWVLRELVRLHARPPGRQRAPSLPSSPAIAMAAPVAAPLLAGWSDRGPPLSIS
jgi:hypothetical protein